MVKPSRSQIKESLLAKKYQKALKPFLKRDKNFRVQWLALLQDLINESESRWDYNSIRYQTVMTKKQWRAFASHPQRKPYRTKVDLPKKYNQKFNFIIEILKNSYQYYKILKESKFKEVLLAELAALLDCALNARYELESMRIADEYYGRKIKDRDDGKINPTPVSLAKLNHAIREHCRTTKKDYQKLHHKIYRLSQGRISILVEYFHHYNIKDEFRVALLEIFKILKRDQTLAFAKIQMGWEIWQKVRKVGLNLDRYLILNGLPKYSTIKKRLDEFQKNQNFIKEILNHFEDELPQGYQRYQKQGFINNTDIIAEEAKRKGYPRKMRTEKEIKKMIKDCQKEICQYFPLAKKSSPRNLFLNPVHPGSTMRAFQSSTKNTKRQQVNVIVMTPRVTQKDIYLPVLAHETTHAVHKMVVEMGEASQVLPVGSGERIPQPVMEEFSQLVEHLFYQDKNLPYRKRFKGKEFSNFYSAMATCIQAPFALVQMGIRKKFDQLWDNGYRGKLKESMIWDLKYEFDEKLKKWMSQGINIVRETLTSFDLFAPYCPTDGVRYIRRYIVKSKSESKKVKVKKSERTILPMAQAFEQRFGKNWIKSKKARTILLWLLLESGRNHQTENFGEFVLNKKAKDCQEELEKICVKEKDI
mgnify:CR=1 FL=1